MTAIRVRCAECGEDFAYEIKRAGRRQRTCSAECRALANSGTAVDTGEKPGEAQASGSSTAGSVSFVAAPRS
jgi:hypothetical protein